MKADLRPAWAVITARMSSSRLPGKSMAELAGRPALRHIIDRLRAVAGLDGIVVATSHEPDDEPIRSCAREAGVECHAGDLDDVLGRVADASLSVGACTTVLVTGDCPMIDPAVVERVLSEYERVRPDYASTVLTEVLTYPAGQSCEAFSASALAAIADEVDDAAAREHVTTHFYAGPRDYRLHSIEAEGRLARPDLWLCLDTEQDLRGVRAIFEELYPSDPLFGYADVLAMLEKRPDLALANAARGRR